jgi:hypothetical protein
VAWLETGTAFPLQECPPRELRKLRQLKHAINIAALAQISHDTPGRAYYLAEQADGKSRKEAMRCLKRRVSDAVFRQLRTDLTR